MTSRLPTAFLMSATMHAAVMALLVALGWLVHEELRTTEPIFILAGTGSVGRSGEGLADTPSDTPVHESGPATIDFHLPKPPPRPVHPVQPPVSESESAVLAKPKAPATPAPRTPPRSPARLPVKDRPRISYQDYADSTPQPGSSTTRPHDIPGPLKPSTPATPPGSSTKGTGSGESAGNTSTHDTQDSYFARLKQRIGAQLVVPAGLADILMVRVEFSLTPSGRLTRVHVLDSSGDAAFDQAVLDAFSRVTPEPAPEGKEASLEMVFRVSDLQHL